MGTQWYGKKDMPLSRNLPTAQRLLNTGCEPIKPKPDSILSGTHAHCSLFLPTLPTMEKSLPSSSSPSGAPPAHAHDPRRLHITAFAETDATLQGTTSLHGLPRLASECALTPPETPVRWQAQGSTRQTTGQPKEIWLELEAEVSLTLQCQRCLQAMQEPVRVQRAFRFVHDEATAAQLDEELEEDVLVISRQFDLLALVEDELIMALPFAPRHAACQPAADLQDSSADEEQPHPFAVLQQLKQKPTQ